MTRTFTTPRFQTVFDRVIEPLALPGELRSGAAPELTTVDQLVRGVAVIGRFIASPGLLGVKVRPTGRPVRVTAHFSFDSMALDWWEERVPLDVGLHGASVPRLLVIRSQGKTRGAALLIRPAADAGRAATGVVCFDLQPEELTEDGLFVFEMDSIDEGRPAWAPAVSAGSIGIMLTAIEFTEVHGDRQLGLVSTGTLPADPESGTQTLRGGYFVANPSDSAEPQRWIARASVVEPLVPGPRTKVAPIVEPVEEPVVEAIEEPVAKPIEEPVTEPVESRPRKSRGIKRRIIRRGKRAARWFIPVAAVPLAKRASKSAARLERKVLRATASRKATPPAAPVSVVPPAPEPPPVPVEATPPVPTEPAPPGPPPNPLADVMFDLVSRGVVQVELVGVESSSMPTVKVRALAGTEIEIRTDGPLTAPALIRLSIDPSVLLEVPGAEGGTVRWDLVVRPGSDAT